MAFPPPNTDPQLAGPMRFADQNRRLKQKEGQILPTPRTYRIRSGVSAGSITTGTKTLGTMPLWIKPEEILMLYCTVDITSSVGSTTARVYAFSDVFTNMSISQYLINASISTTRTTYASSPLGGTAATPANTASGWVVYPPFWTGSAEAGTVAAPTAVDLGFFGSRGGGTGALTFNNLRAWAMIV